MSERRYRSYARVKKQIMESEHYFQLLGVYRASTHLELTLARRELVKHVHPDINAARDAHELTARVNAAHAALEADCENYVRSLMKRTCTACKGAGAISRSKGFSKKVVTICTQCHGAGVA